MSTALWEAILGLGPPIRYVAFGGGQRVEPAPREGVAATGHVAVCVGDAEAGAREVTGLIAPAS